MIPQYFFVGILKSLLNTDYVVLISAVLINRCRILELFLLFRVLHFSSSISSKFKPKKWLNCTVCLFVTPL